MQCYFKIKMFIHAKNDPVFISDIYISDESLFSLMQLYQFLIDLYCSHINSSHVPRVLRQGQLEMQCWFLSTKGKAAESAQVCAAGRWTLSWWPRRWSGRAKLLWH